MNETLASSNRSATDGPLTIHLPAQWVVPSANADDQHHIPSTSSIRVGCVVRNRYVLEERLGIGGKGTVFKALDRYRSDLPEEDRYVAIKILHPNADNRGERVADLRREFYCAQTLSHESIVNVYQLDRDEEIDFFTMELLEGELLSSVLARLQPAPMSRPQAWAIIRDIGAGLAHAHSRNVVHADLRPHNIMITHSGEVRILDFSHAVGHYAEDIGPRRMSTPCPEALSYACCELLAGRPPDPRDDVYALACLSYELLAGEHPFQRRPATEARALGIVAKRPPGLTRQQWHTLAMGLSWHRAARSISVRAWLDKMKCERTATRRVPDARGVQTAPADSGTASLRATTMFVVLLMTVGMWVSVVRWASGSRSTANDTVPQLLANDLHQSGQPDQSARRNDPPGEVPVAAGPVATSPVAAGRDGVSTASAPRLSSNREHAAGRPKAASASDRPSSVSAGTYAVRWGEHFAEIRVRRSNLLPSGTEFVWWTEAASAKPGVDYIHQSKVIQSFPRGKTSTSFFVKLVPRASRTHPEVFYVAIAEAGRNAADPVARAAVWLPMNQDHSQAAAEHDTHAESETHAESGTHADSSFSTAALESPLRGSK